MRKWGNDFWEWYERHLTLNVTIAAFLFSLQLVHLYWLATDVIALKLFGQSFFQPSGFFYFLIIFADYAEVPALISTGLIYINRLRSSYEFKSLLFIIFLSLQVFHLFWITDEFVIDAFTGGGAFLAIPPILAMLAIMIDYMEVPVILDTFKKLYHQIRRRDK